MIGHIVLSRGSVLKFTEAEIAQGYRKC